MRGMNRGFRYCLGLAGLTMAATCMFCAPGFGQNSAPPANSPFNQVVHALPPGGPPPRLSDGHVDFSGRYYPNSGGKMLDSATPGRIDPGVGRNFDSRAEEKLSFKPGMAAKYMSPVPYGVCDQAGTPSAWTMQTSQHAPMELISSPSRVIVLTEYPLDVRMIYMNRPHPKDPDPTFNGDSAAHWEGDTLVVDVIAIDDRLRNVAVGGFSGEGNAWLHTDQEHIIERWSRPSKNYLTYQVTIEDPQILTKPWTSAPRTWSLAATDDEWTEVFCTHNEEPEEWKHLDKGLKEDYEDKYKK
jgi:hypothetical protein